MLRLWKNLKGILLFPCLCVRLLLFSMKGHVTGYSFLTWEFDHAWNFMKLCALMVLIMIAIITLYALVIVIPLAKYNII